MKLERSTYIGAVTAITYSPDGNYIVYGIWLYQSILSIGSGSTIYIYNSQTFGMIKTLRVLKNALIHGIRFCSFFNILFTD